jgi:pyruvate,orthophosphate dikinase
MSGKGAEAVEYVYRFDHDHRADAKTLRRRLGGKGMFLNRITRMKDPDLQVPPGFTITTDACHEILANEHNEWPPELKQQVQDHLDALLKENTATRWPPLLSIRSGAPRPMLGLLQTVLNVGMNRSMLTSTQPERRFLADCYRRFLASYGHAVLGVPEERFNRALANTARSPRDRAPLEIEQLTALIDDYLRIIVEHGSVPEDRDEQVRNAITAVIRSWASTNARDYRDAFPDPDDIGTAVNVQMMVFGNRNEQSGSGVAYSRNPVSGKHKIAGDYLLNSQGEDVVRGYLHMARTSELIESEKFPMIAEGLKRALPKLEHDLFEEVCEVEFTFENDDLWILQARKAKLTGRATLEVARSMVEDEERFITERQAIDRIEVEDLVHALHKTVNLTPAQEQDPSFRLAARGTTTVSPGAAVGEAAFTAADAESMIREGKNVILITEYTTPQDNNLIRRLAGVVEFRAGFSSHSMVLARSFAKPFITGVAGHIHRDPGTTGKSFCDFGGPTLPYRVGTGDTVTLDATNCRLFGRELPLAGVERHAAVDSLLGWVERYKPANFEFRVNANTPEQVVEGVEEGADGVGICRTEQMLDDREKQALVQLADRIHAKRDYKEVAMRLEAFFADQFERMLKSLEHRGRRAKRPFAVRLLDRLPPVEEWPLEHRRFSDLAALRGVRIGILLEPIYRLQVRALLEAARRRGNNHGRVIELIVPYVIDPSELDRIRAMVMAEKDEFFGQHPARMDGLSVFIGPMIETPRAIMLSGDFAEAGRSDFFSYGTNDLTELVFGIGEPEGSLAARYSGERILREDPHATLDPSVQRMMRASVRRARDRQPDIKLGVASEHAFDVRSIELFLRSRFRYVSCIQRQLPVARFAVAKAFIKLGLGDDEP